MHQYMCETCKPKVMRTMFHKCQKMTQNNQDSIMPHSFMQELLSNDFVQNSQ